MHTRAQTKLMKPGSLSPHTAQWCHIHQIARPLERGGVSGYRQGSLHLKWMQKISTCRSIAFKGNPFDPQSESMCFCFKYSSIKVGYHVPKNEKSCFSRGRLLTVPKRKQHPERREDMGSQ